MEVAAGAVVAEQAVSTAVEAGVAYGIAKPTPPLSATFTRISSPAFLPRLKHSLAVVNGQIYLFGGEDETGKLAGDEVHIVSLPLKSAGNEGKPDYSEGEDGKVPGKRAGHSSIAVAGKIYIFGGSGEDGKPIEEMGRVWMYNTKTLGWSYIDPAEDASLPPARHMHGAVSSDRPASATKAGTQHTMTEQISSTISKLPSMISKTSIDDGPSEPHGTLIIHGGQSASSSVLNDTWAFNIATRTWSSLLPLPSSSSPTSSLAFVYSTLYTISGTTEFAHEISTLPLKPKSYINLAGENTEDFLSTQETWSTITIPTNPLTPGPKSRTGAPFLPISTGAGRDYILYLLGEQTSAPKSPPGTDSDDKPDPSSTTPENTPVYYSDTWAYGLAPPATTPAGIKDAIRSTVGASVSSATWAEVIVDANVEPEAGEATETGGKAHPGPRAWFAADRLEGGKGVVMWGGRNGRGEVEGDGWLVNVA
ncbi:uncharacterized protein KY384_008875 [Bacidia gigantensis]|uniref:uncharacterized protein n=1 Tax=Bacidia gigantensis TaxID=2732470 RepID=UPI001D050977|nr:uncharacterized protein KY384_008875 [Bacidia gigantensis]KAG8525231.1 hypothetical protein KY384_008875 [Bacidia gigantensis]